MAIAQGVRKLLAWVQFGGLTIPTERAQVQLQGQSKTGHWEADVPMYYPGAYETAVSLGAQNNCSITVSLNGVSSQLVTGQANKVTFDFIHTIIRVEGDDGSGKLHNVKSSESFKNQTNAQVAEQLVGRVGLGFASTVSSFMAGRQMQGEYVKMFDGISYAAALHKLAEADSARWWVQNNVVNYAPQSSGEGTYQLNYQRPTPERPMRSDCLDLTVLYNVQAGQPQQVTVNAWHSHDKKAHRAVTFRPGIGPTFMHEYNIPQIDQQQAQQHADSKAEAFHLNALELTALVAGDPTINAAMMVNLSGTGAMDGEYIMKEVIHQVGWQGYTTLIKATRGID